ncbi:MAG: DUF86 domain-containing protein [Myxococcales bacterium]|nr:DUF86 domain-containing protein [Myxococcales bacterium]
MSEAHLRLLEEVLAAIDRYARTVTREALEKDLDTWLKVRGALELAAQSCIDLAMVIIAQRGLGVPQTYREAFLALARAGVVDSALADELAKWAGFRNALVHIYTALDLDVIHRALGEAEPLRRFFEIAARELMPSP